MRIEIIALVLASGSAVAAEPDIKISPGGEMGLVDWGTYAGRDTGETVAEDTVEGRVHQQSGTTLLQTGDEICAQAGTSFGIRYRLDAGIADAEWILDVRTTHPLLVAPSGRSGTTGAYQTHILSGSQGYSGWTVRYPYERVAGDYSFSLLHDGRVMLRKTFHVAFDCTVPVS